MITNDQARTIALSFPGAEELEHHGHPDFRVANKVFVTLWPTERRSVVKLSADEQADLVRTNRRAFSLNAWSKQGWTNVHLAHVSTSEFRTVAEASWRRVAPKRLVRAYDAEK